MSFHYHFMVYFIVIYVFRIIFAALLDITIDCISSGKALLLETATEQVRLINPNFYCDKNPRSLCKIHSSNAGIQVLGFCNNLPLK